VANRTKLIKIESMTIALLLIFGFYFIFLLALLYGWERTLIQPVSNSTDFHSITVIIPFRNEEENIETLIQSLQSLNYPKEKLEIILVNDHSSDQSLKALNKLATPFLLINLEDNEVGKKAALTKGIEIAKSEIIVTSDADCKHPTQWLQSINSFFANPQTQMVVGGVTIQNSKSFFTKLQAIEWASLIGSGASLLQWHIPAMANGANLAFRKSAFLAVGGYEGNEHIASGDDEFLLRKIFKAFPNGIQFNHQLTSVVQTLPQKKIFNFFQQRFRWAGKWKHQTNGKVKLVAFVVFIFQPFFMTSFFLLGGEHQRLVSTMLLAKAGLEGIFLFRVCQFLGVRFTIIPFMMLQLLYPFYVVLTAILSLFVKSSWKGRKS